MIVLIRQLGLSQSGARRRRIMHRPMVTVYQACTKLQIRFGRDDVTYQYRSLPSSETHEVGASHNHGLYNPLARISLNKDKKHKPKVR
jgi:hypothetical protein